MDRIGERIKRKRELLRMHLNELADKVGISSSAVSQIEKSKSFPSILTLKAIAEALHTTIGELVGENESLAGNPVVQRAELRFINQNSAGTAIYSMSNRDANKQMDTFMVRFAKGANMDGLFTSTYGQVFCHVVMGEVKFDLKDKQYVLKQGDSIYFNAKHQHAVQNASDGESEVIWVQSPPNF